MLPRPDRRSLGGLPRSALLLALLAGFTPAARANHGPGTSGGGSSTVSGETLRAGGFDLSLRTDVTWYESFTRAEAASRAMQHGEFDGLHRSLVETLGIAWGATDDLQVGAQLGWYRGTGFVAAEDDGMGGADVATADPRGLTDLWLQAKLRVLRGPGGHLACLAGVKLPTGDDDEELSDGSELEPSSQPGTGAVDFQFGLAYSRYLSARTTLDASGVYTFRGEHGGFEVGDRLDAGAALAYRLTEDVRHFPNWSLSAELLGVWIGQDEEGGARNENSGGTTVYLAPGVRGRLNPHVAVSLAPSVPVFQDLDGDQVETRARVACTLSFTL